MRVGVRVPATTANLGSGFDGVGMAFDWYDEVFVETLDEDRIEVLVTGEGADQVPRDERHLVVSSLLTGLEAFGAPRIGLRLSSVNTIPHSRGMGSSASAIAAGLSLAYAIAHPGRGLDRVELTRLGARLEGHPDNIGAAIWGGAILAWTSGDDVALVRLGLHPQLSAVAFLPEVECATSQARSVLPDDVPRADAVAQAIAAAALPLALHERPDLLLAATADRLHQPYRAELMPQSHALMQRLRSAGVPAAISGAGPTVIAVGTPEQLELAGPVASSGFTVRELAVGAGVELLD